jgi:hypothetical protein
MSRWACINQRPQLYEWLCDGKAKAVHKWQCWGSLSYLPLLVILLLIHPNFDSCDLSDWNWTSTILLTVIYSVHLLLCHTEVLSLVWCSCIHFLWNVTFLCLFLCKTCNPDWSSSWTSIILEPWVCYLLTVKPFLDSCKHCRINRWFIEPGDYGRTDSTSLISTLYLLGHIFYPCSLESDDAEVILKTQVPLSFSPWSSCSSWTRSSRQVIGCILARLDLLAPFTQSSWTLPLKSLLPLNTFTRRYYYSLIIFKNI